jgi:carboxymethylenebutenolidase
MLRRRTVLAGVTGLSLLVGSRARADTGLEAITTKGANGEDLTAFLAVPSDVPAPAVLMLHGASGMSPFYKQTAVEFAKQGFICIVFQWYAWDAAQDIATWVKWLKSDSRSTGKVGIVGYSSGAEFALKAANTLPIDATVLYTGMAALTVDELRHLSSPVLGLYSDRGNDPIPDNVKALEARMKEAGKSFEVHWYAVDHAFANPLFPAYNKAAADAAWASTVEFLHRNLR